MERTRRDIEQETRRALEEIRKEVANLTVLATEKVTRKSLDGDDHRRLVRGGAVGGRLLPARSRGRGQRGLGELRDGRDRRGLRPFAVRGRAGARRARRVHDQLGQFADALSENRKLQVFFFSPYFSSEEKKDGVSKVIEGGNEHFVHFLELLAERHRLPVLFRIRREFDALWAEEHKLLPVSVTSAVELDEETVKQIGADRGADRTDGGADLEGGPRRDRRPRGPRRQHGAGRERAQPARTTQALGGNRRLKTEKGKFPTHADQPRRDHQHPQGPHRGTRGGRRGPVRGRHGPVRRRRHLPRPRARQLHVARAARAAARRDRPRAEPRVRQRRRRAVRRVGQDRGGRHGEAHRPPARGPGRRRAARPHRRPARQPARRQGRRRTRPRPVPPSSRRPAWCTPAGEGADADRHQGDRRDDRSAAASAS